MVTLKKRINALNHLGKLFEELCNSKKNSKYDFWIKKFEKEIIVAHQYNNWFTKEYILLSLNQWSKELSKKNIISWIKEYNIKDCSDKTVAIIMAGNLPLVGFHDLLCAILLNFNCIIKLSSNDKVLIPLIVDYLNTLIPSFKNKIKFVDKPLKNFDGVIATGSNSSFNHFEYYFKNYPRVLRKSRHSIAILNGKESKSDLKSLGNDIFNYFGMGCRSVSKIFVPTNYNFDLLFNALYDFRDIINHNKYANNYDYNKAVYLMGEQKFIENGFLLIKKDNNLGSPIACLFYENYNSISEIKKKVKSFEDSLQCVVSNIDIFSSIKFGLSQYPKINNYADNVDTLKFLLKI